MKTITLDKIGWQGDTTFYTPAETQRYYGVPRQVKVIVIHWWNTPEKAGTFDQTIGYLKGVEESIHFVVSGDKVTQMVNMANTAFHTIQANPISVGIEVDPKLPGNTYETVGALVKFIRGYYGNIPTKPHNLYVATTCPGIIDLKKIEQYATGNVPAPKPVTPVLTKKTTYTPTKQFKVNTQTHLVNIPSGTKFSGTRTYNVGDAIGDVAELLEYSDGKKYYRTKYARDTAKKMYGFVSSKLSVVSVPSPVPKPVPEKPTMEEQLAILKKENTGLRAILQKIKDALAGI